ncbi:MAG: hypothetical protein A2W04_10780 [Betaproteobacteria bacterium RBG_16_64_9]|nr:MAG: hypothetical protein A2W04_10780 [Betaproteobacteria bacterium RBG_16_64_9]
MNKSSPRSLSPRKRGAAFGRFPVEKAFAGLEQVLASGSDWILESGYSLADINLMPYVARLDYLELLDIWTGARPVSTPGPSHPGS